MAPIPGLISHFLKQALLNFAKEKEISIPVQMGQKSWATLARSLDVKVIQIAESDSQTANLKRDEGSFYNTWSVDGLISEAGQAAELGWGSHESDQVLVHYPSRGSRSAVFMDVPGALTKVRTWNPLEHDATAYLITHNESISIAEYLTLYEQGDVVSYRPTVYYAYSPSIEARSSLEAWVCGGWQEPQTKKVLIEELSDTGEDALGVLLLSGKYGGYWFGSILAVDEARKLAPFNNATSLQVVAGVLSGMAWAIKNPLCGVIEAEQMDFQEILTDAQAFIGDLTGMFVNWHPSYQRGTLGFENFLLEVNT